MEKQFVPTDRQVVADVVQRYLDASAWLRTARHGSKRRSGCRSTKKYRIHLVGKWDAVFRVL
jgi:hypothetical protein